MSINIFCMNKLLFLPYANLLLSSALAVALVLGVASCKTEEDELGIIDQIEDGGYTNDSDYTYARGYVSTKTKHLGADCQIDIDTNNSSDGGYTMGYIFNQIGKGTEENPYSFICVGVRYYSKTVQYFVSYYTGVLSEDFTTDAGDFDVSSTEATKWNVNANSATEYGLTKGWGALNSEYYTLSDEGILTVYIDLDVYSDTTPLTSDTASLSSYISTITDDDGDNVSQVTNGKYIINFRKSADATDKKNVTIASGTTAYINGSTSSTIPTNFYVREAKLGRYAMVSKGSTLAGTWTFPKDSYVKSATNPNGEVFIWDEEIDNVR